MSSKTNKTLNSLQLSSFSEQKARRLFQLKQDLSPKLLKEWYRQSTNIEINQEEMRMIEKLQAKLTLYVRGWNEDELKIKFIAPLIELVNFDNFDLEVSSFSERPLNLKIKGKEIKGIVDLMVATGISAPEHPFFFHT